ncbi:MAG TPA: ribose 5-phosphate isomerase B [Ruminococcaceae bacterium]|nr:ribose 5-phosphate isomerase B [Oscillospiraceae bacterium]
MLVIGSDHAGFNLKREIMRHLDESGTEYKDVGCYSDTPADYPEIAQVAAELIINGECERGILVCGAGIGMSIAANKIPGIRAALCGEGYSARMARSHNDANILCMGARVTGPGIACEIVDIFLSAGFESGRHQKRIDLMEKN